MAGRVIIVAMFARALCLGPVLAAGLCGCQHAGSAAPMMAPRPGSTGPAGAEPSPPTVEPQALTTPTPPPQQPQPPIVQKPAFAPDEIWIHRALTMGRARPQASLVVSTLSRDRKHAHLVVETRTAPFTGREAADLPWQTSLVRHYAGDVVEANGRVELHLADALTSEPYTLLCAHATRAVAPARAIRIRDPKVTGECGNPGTWNLPSAGRTAVLACGTTDAPLDFALAPGLETVGISEDCYQSGRGDRLVGDDSALAPTGSPHH